MKRNQITPLDTLHQGDRFYRQNCRSKISMEFIGESGKLNKYHVIDSIHVRNGAFNGNLVKEMKGNTNVVFLRNVNDQS